MRTDARACLNQIRAAGRSRDAGHHAGDVDALIATFNTALTNSCTQLRARRAGRIDDQQKTARAAIRKTCTTERNRDTAEDSAMSAQA